MKSKLELSARFSGLMEAFEDVGTEADAIEMSFDFGNELHESKVCTFYASCVLQRVLRFMDRNGFDVQHVLAETIQSFGEAGHGDDGSEAEIFMGEMYEAACSVLKASGSST